MSRRRRFLCVLSSAIVLVLLIPLFPAAADSSAGWGLPELIEHQDLGDAERQKIVMDSNGNAIAVWHQYDGSVYSVWANRYISGYGWDTATVIEYDLSYDARFPDVAMNDNGDAIAVFRLNDGTRDNIWANHYTKDLGWGIPVLIELNNFDHASDPHVAMNNNGNAVAVWRSPGTPYSISASNYTQAGGWSPEEIIESESTYAAYNPRVAMDENGNAVAVMQIWDGSKYNLYANNFTKGVGWDSAVLIEDNDNDSMDEPYLSMDENGNAIAVWNEWDSVASRYNISWNRYEIGTGWGIAALLENYNAGSSSFPDVAMNAPGDAMATWQQWESGQYNLYARRYTLGSGWGQPICIGYTESASISDGDVALSDNGDALAVWSQNDGFSSNIYANRFTIGTGWGTITLIENYNVDSAILPEVVADDNGNAIAIWLHSDRTYYSIWANRYVAPDDKPPTLSILNPTSGAIVDIPTITVSGTTEPGVHLVVNGIVVNVASDGTFEFLLALSEGENLITAKASDASDNSVTKSVTVTYINPTYALEQELQETKDELNATKDNLTETKNALENTQTELNETKDNLNETKNALENTQTELDEIKIALENTQTELDEAISNLTDTKIALENTQAELEDTNDDLADAKEKLESQEMLILLLPIIVLAILIIILIILYMNLAKKIGGKGKPPSELPEETPTSETDEVTAEKELEE